MLWSYYVSQSRKEIVGIQTGFQTRTDRVSVAYRREDVTLDHIIGVLTSREAIDFCCCFRQVTLVHSTPKAITSEFLLVSCVDFSQWSWRR